MGDTILGPRSAVSLALPQRRFFELTSSLRFSFNRTRHRSSSDTLAIAALDCLAGELLLTTTSTSDRVAGERGGTNKADRFRIGALYVTPPLYMQQQHFFVRIH